jgi:ribonuclease Z
MTLGGISFEAFSVSGLATYVMVPALDAVFDLGHCSVEAAALRNVFLSHVHQDHAGGVPRHLSLRAMFGSRPSRVYCPAQSANALIDMLHAWNRLEEKPETDLSQVVKPLLPGQTVSLGKRYSVQCFDVVHRVPSLGFTVIEHRTKLRAAYAGMPGIEIHAARLRGEVVSDVRDYPVLTYIGDSTIETLLNHPEVGLSEVLFLEATHVGDTPREAATKWGHTHLDEIVDLLRTHPEMLPNPHIVIKHFSMKYAEKHIRKAIEALPSEFRQRVTVLAHL